MTTEEVASIVHNLEVHQNELEAQNQELRRVQVQLGELRDRYRDLYEYAPVGYLTLDMGMHIIDANLAAARLVGYVPIGKRVEMLFVPADRDACYRLLHQTGYTEEHSCELRLAHTDGRALYVNVEVSSIPQLAAQAPGGFGVILTDVSDRRKAEEALRQANANLEQKVRERTAELTERAAKLRALAKTLTLAEQRERGRIANVLHDHVQQLLVAAKFRIAGLGSRAESGIRRSLVEIDTLLDQAIESSRTLTVQLSPPILEDASLAVALEWLGHWMAEKHGLRVDLSVEPELPHVSNEIKFLLFETVRELLFNVIKHAKVTEATVNVCAVGGRELAITVADNGIGFDPKPLISGRMGKGFGLFSIQERLDSVGGGITIDSAPGQGSRVTITLAPESVVSPQPPMLTRRRRMEPQHEPQTGPRSGRIRLLLADDHIVMREGLAQLLRQESDIEIVGEAVDGQEAIEMARKLLPDIILMDVNMPNLNGVEATRIIHAEFPAIGIIGLSMFGEAERAQAMADAGAARYVAKSGPSADLMEVIRATAQRLHPAIQRP